MTYPTHPQPLWLVVARPGRHYEEQASALYCGEFLEGFSIADSASFDKWSLFTREQLRMLVCDLLRRLAEPPTGVSDASPVCDYARRWVCRIDYRTENSC